ncbi:hypothetical protein B296_00043888 [Ensete ventricosum]|uniref:Dof zinc finger protein n=1 Tax=Ensete ventricosum TaxID=4639 RepID=A0A426ZCY2_ENSVE|nr:hypothetical protein B296_00043888 [Ensete ventricosum]
MPQHLFYHKLACALLGPISTLVACGAPELRWSWLTCTRFCNKTVDSHCISQEAAEMNEMATEEVILGIGLVKPVKEFASSTTITSGSDTCTTTRTQVTERRPRPHKEQALNCPRCNSTNTKFCYYNNYSLTQPRYFCKTCRRYWTEGGSLRNVPVGGGSRKNKRSSMSSATAISSSSCNSITESLATASAPKKFYPDLIPPSILLATNAETPKLLDKQDLSLAFRQHSIPEYNDYLNLEISNANNISSSNSNYCAAVRALSDMEILKNNMSAKGIGSLMPLPMTAYPTGLGLQGFRPPTLSFPFDGISGGGGGGSGDGGYGDLSGIQESVTGKLLFPLEVLKPEVPSNNVADQFEVQGDDPPRYWNGVIGGSSW